MEEIVLFCSVFMYVYCLNHTSFPRLLCKWSFDWFGN